MTKFYNSNVTDFFNKLEKSINKFFGKSDLESKTENLKEENTISLKESSSVSLNDFKNHEGINPTYINPKNNYHKKHSHLFYSIFV